MLTTASGPIDIQQLVAGICRLRPDWQRSEIGGFRYLEGGYSNLNVRFSHRNEAFVLRVPGPFAPPQATRTLSSRSPTGAQAAASQQRAREASLYRLLAGNGLPSLVGFDEESGWMITRWVTGHLLADLTPAPDTMVDYLRELHRRLLDLPARLPTLAGCHYDPVAISRDFLAAADMHGRVPEWIRQIAATLQWRPETSLLCHNDLNPWNLIQTPAGNWVTLDWEWIGWNDPLFDLVVLHQSLGVGASLLDDMARRYLDTAPLPPGRLHACELAFWLREYSWAEAQLARGESRREIVAQRDLGLHRLAALRERTRSA